MSRYRGAKLRITRRLGDLPGLTSKSAKRTSRQGQHGGVPKKLTQFGLRLEEKQKLRFNYGVSEKQLINYVKQARRIKGTTGTILLQLLEMRLDNLVFRLGLAPTIAAARQLVSHRHITVNGKVVNIASYTLKKGDLVAVRERSKSLEVITDAITSNRHTKYSWLEWDKDTFSGKFINIPERSEIPENIKEQLIVELYSK